MDVTFPAAVWVLLQDLTPTNHEHASAAISVSLQTALASQQFTIPLDWTTERKQSKTNDSVMRRLAGWRDGGKIWSIVERGNILPCQLYINSKYACHVCDSSRHAFKTIMSEPMSWKYTVRFIVSVKKMPGEDKNKHLCCLTGYLPTTHKFIQESGMSQYIADIKIHSSKHVNTARKCAHTWIKAYSVCGGNEQTSW